MSASTVHWNLAHMFQGIYISWQNYRVIFLKYRKGHSFRDNMTLWRDNQIVVLILLLEFWGKKMRRYISFVSIKNNVLFLL